MSTLDRWFHPFSGLILGLQTLRDYLLTPLRETLAETWTDLWGTGGLVIGTAPSFSVSSSRLTLAADRVGWTGDGHRLTIDNAAGLGFASIPFEDGAGPYYLGAKYAERPQGTTLGFNGLPGYLTYVETIGETYTPTSVSATGAAEITVVMTSALPAAMKWSNASHTRPVVVWLYDGPAADSTQAIYEGSLVKDGSAYKIVIPHFLGQTVPSTTASAYRVLVLGLTISTSALSAACVGLGQVSSSTYATTGVNTVASFGDYVTAYLTQHAIDGTHTDITADTIALQTNSAGITYDTNRSMVSDVDPRLGGWQLVSGPSGNAWWRINGSYVEHVADAAGTYVWRRPVEIRGAWGGVDGRITALSVEMASDGASTVTAGVYPVDYVGGGLASGVATATSSSGSIFAYPGTGAPKDIDSDVVAALVVVVDDPAEYPQVGRFRVTLDKTGVE